MPAPAPDAQRCRNTADVVALPCRYCRDGEDSSGTEPGWLRHLYLCRGMSTYQIAARSGLSRQRVTRILRKAGVQLHAYGAGRRRSVSEPPGLPELMRKLYEDAKLTSRQVAAVLGMPERTVRDRLHRYGIAARTRGGWNREDRVTVPSGVLDTLYSQLGMTAAEVGQRLGMSRNAVLRSAHVKGVPVRSGGAVPLPGPEAIELIGALYDDRLVDAALTAHGVPRVPPGDSISQRFPQPVPLTTPLVKDLYWSCGVGLNHIELLTGQSAGTIRGFMRRADIPLRHPGGRTPFLRRWRERYSGALVSRSHPSANSQPATTSDGQCTPR